MLEIRGETAAGLFSGSPPPSGDSEEFIQALRARLHPESLEILVLREAEGFSYEEIGEILGCSMDAVKGRLKRARQEARKKLRHFMAREHVKPSEVPHAK